MKKFLLVLFLFSVLGGVAQDIEGFRFLQRIRGIRIDDCKVQEIALFEETGDLVIAYRAKKIMYISFIKLYSWDKVKDVRIDERLELYSSFFGDGGRVFYANTDFYKQDFLSINLYTGETEFKTCDQTPRGCVHMDQAVYPVELYTEDRMIYVVRDTEHPDDILVYMDKLQFDELRKKMEEELKRDVYAKEVKEKIENDARKEYGMLPGQQVAVSSDGPTEPDIVITREDIVQLMSKGYFEKSGMKVQLQEEVRIKIDDSKPTTKATGTKNLGNAEFKEGEVIELKNISFDQGSSSISQSSFPELNKLVSILKTNATMKIEVVGHTNNIGIKNQEISEERAKAVVDYLVEKGISVNRLTYKGYGDTKPIATNETEEGRAKNRRVEFVIKAK